MQLNAFFVIIVAALALEYVLSMSAKLLNLKALEPKPPEALDDIYDAGEYRRSQEYTRAKTRFELASKSFSLARCWLSGSWGASTCSTRPCAA